MTEPREIFAAHHTELAEGITLVEASAGTGKTFAISMLVLRAVVELGMKIQQILVVTYTVAATEELRGRVRNRLVQARDLLRGSAADADDVLRTWVAGVADHQMAVRRLELALVEIDSLAVYTIHGFCQRILREQVLQSRHFFESELISDVTPQRSRLVHDFWREHLYRLEDRYGRVVVARFSDPDRLYKSIIGAEDPLARLLPEKLDFSDACSGFDHRLGLLRKWWGDRGTELKQCLLEADALGLLKKQLSTVFSGWFDELEFRLSSGSSPDASIVAGLLEDNLVGGINGNKVRGPDKQRALVQSWPLPGDAAVDYIAACDGLCLALRLELAGYLRTALPEQLHARGKLSFDELIVALARALDSEHGAELAQEVGGRYKMALIDEFQDTDSAQYRIFFRLFGLGSHHLYLIGDPKQAIYRFRGADINSYLQARHRVRKRLTLDRNFRSHPGLVAAVNRLFEEIEVGGSVYQPVNGEESLAATRLVDSGMEQAGLVYMQLEQAEDGNGRWSTGSAEERIRSWVVEEVSALIEANASLAVEEQDADGTTTNKQIQPGDIGVLVRTNRQAEALFNEFSRRAIPVVISSRKSVFQTRESLDLLLTLKAVAAPADATLLRSAMSCDWYGLSGDQYYRIASDEKSFGRYFQRFQQYRRIWQEAGLLLMMEELVEQENLFLNLSRRPQAERRIANIQHLVELIQKQQSDARLSLSQTLIWLQDRQNNSGSVEEAEIRLESDEQAVNVVTMHSAKGLEYPVVFCPFLGFPAITREDAGVVTCHDEQLGRVCDLGSDRFQHHKSSGAAEDAAEELRLAYVAITRARLRCYLVWGDIVKGRTAQTSFASSLGSMLFPDGACPFDDQRRVLQRLGSASHCRYQLISCQEQPALEYRRNLQAPLELRPRARGDRLLQTSRLRTSFSGLVMLSRNHGHPEAAAGAFDEGRHQGGTETRDRLPGGVRFGTMIHDALEKHDFAGLAHGPLEQAQIEVLLRRYQIEVDYQQVEALLRAIVTTRLAEQGRGAFSLAELQPDRLVKEMEFTLHLERSSTRQINRILQLEESVGELSEREIEGYLSGFIDLVCEHQGRYYIIDYKTNYLGTGNDYDRGALSAAMRAHNYGLQYWLYSLVVHRWLQRWVPGYSYQDQFGGVMYLFVRGMLPDVPGSGVFFARPGEQTLGELDRCFGGGCHV